MQQRTLWPAIIGIVSILIAVLICGCGLVQTAATLLSPEPLQIVDDATLSDDLKPVFAALGIGCYAVPTLLVAGLGCSIWIIYSRNPPYHRRGARLGFAGLIICGVLCAIWAVLIFGAITLMGSAIGLVTLGRPLGLGEAAIGLLMYGLFALFFFAASAAIWFLYIRRQPSA
jgi:hypothetical protein